MVRAPENDAILTPVDAARVLGISRRTFDRLITDGAPILRVSERHKRFRWGDLEAWLKAREVTGAKRARI